MTDLRDWRAVSQDDDEDDEDDDEGNQDQPLLDTTRRYP